jgi:predicted peroxiredoxin
VKGNITASAIGPESNLEKGTKFTIQGLSSSLFFALNDGAALSGGTKRQARTVAKKDLDDLQTKALEEGKKQGLDELRQKTSAEEQLIDGLTTQSAGKLDFSKDVGDEADEVTLKATVNTTYYSYTASHIKDFIKKSLDTDVPPGFSLPSESITYTIKDASKKGKVTLTVDGQGKALKEISKDQLLTDVKGKNPKDAEQLLKSKYGASEVTIENKGIGIFPWLPMSKKNITVNINSL